MSKRIQFIKNLQDLERDSSNSNIIEYEVIADAKIIGQYDYGEYSFMLWEFSEKEAGEERKLSLRIREKIFDYDSVKDNVSKNGYYHGGNIADEIVAIASLALRRRFRLGDVYRMNDRPIYYSGRKLFKDKPIIKGSSNVSDQYKGA